MPQRPCSEALFGGTVGGSGGCGGEGGRRAAGNGGEEVLCCSVAGVLPRRQRDNAGTQGTGAVGRQRWERLEGVGPRVLWDVAAGTGTTRRGEVKGSVDVGKPGRDAPGGVKGSDGF